MEHHEIREQLRLAERAEAAPYVDYPSTPWWYYPLTASWAAAFVAVFALDGPAFAIGVVTLVVAELAFLAWLHRWHGALPSPGQPGTPPEVAAAYRRYFLGLAGVVLVVALTAWLVAVPVGAVLAFVLVGGGLLAYEHDYARAADEVKARLA